MKTTDTSEKGLETIIVDSLIGEAGYEAGNPPDYDREHAIDTAKLFAFLQATQPLECEKLGLNENGSQRTQFLHRLQGEITKRGVIDVLHNGVKHLAFSLQLFYGIPTLENTRAVEQHNANIFSVTRQLCYSRSETRLALDMVLFINGLPVATFELKNRFTRQTVEDAIQQYKRDRDPRELLFQFGRCVVHFALDDQDVFMCTHLQGNTSWFLPFNKGQNDGRGNPPNPDGIATDYLWKNILTKPGLSDILENYARVVEEHDQKTGKKKKRQVFPRYHQLAVVRKLLADALASGYGKRYLIQHSAGSGKSNSIAWLAYQLAGLHKEGRAMFDSVIVITDRRVLDRQICDTIKHFASVTAVVGHADRSENLRSYLQTGKKIIITTVQKFPFVLDEIGSAHRSRHFALIIDEAHSSQGGKTTTAMNRVLEPLATFSSEVQGEVQEGEEEDTEDKINRIMESRKMLGNADYFAFTATPKNKTLEIFGVSYREGEAVKYRPFHTYTMKQAIQEGFILDVLKNYTPVESYYRLAKTVPDDPTFDTKKAQKKLRSYVESHSEAIRDKAEIMVDHFHEQVMAHNKIGGRARAIVVTSSIKRAIEYFHAIERYLRERKSQYRAIVAFSGEHEYGGRNVDEAALNGFSSNLIPEKIQEDPYRFLVVADKFLTGYDEPLLHTMYVDKPLSGIKAVQTLSRLNRAHPQKYDTFVLDFYNSTETITLSFQDYYRTTVLSEQTDPNKLNDLQSDLARYEVYSQEQIDTLVRMYLDAVERPALDAILNTCRDNYKQLDEDSQVDFKGKAKAFERTYNFLASILPYSSMDWEKLSIFLNLLIPKLPAPQEDDLSRGILESIDMDSYRSEVQATRSIALDDNDAEIDPFSTGGGGMAAEPEVDKLSVIIKTFNEHFGGIAWQDVGKAEKTITEDLPAKVSMDEAYQNAMQNSDEQNARIELDKALRRAMFVLLQDNTELFKQYSDNASFNKWLTETVFDLTYRSGGRQ